MEDQPGQLEHDPRSVVNERLGRQVVRYPDLAIESMNLRSRQLEARELAFARALESSVLCRWRTLEHLVSACSRRSWARIEPSLRGALLAGAAQVILMDSVPDHAAVDETVEWCKRRVRPDSGRFVNGVLRGLIRLRGEVIEAEDERARSWWLHRDVVPLADGRALGLGRKTLPDDPASRLAIQSSIGDELISSWIASAGWETTLERCAHCLMTPPLMIAGAGGSFEVWTGGLTGLRERLAAEPGSRVQDPTAASAVESTRALSPTCIVDFCAGRGTKTGQLAQVHPAARVLAGDANEERRCELATAFEGDPRIEVVEPRRYGSVLGSVDLLVLDVPCSNSGVLPRRPQARYRANRRRMKSLRTLQRQIVEESIPLLAPGAHLLYSTCSLETAENEEQVDWLVKKFDARVVLQNRIEPEGRPGDEGSGYRDGGFHALLTREPIRSHDESC